MSDIKPDNDNVYSGWTIVAPASGGRVLAECKSCRTRREVRRYDITTGSSKGCRSCGSKRHGHSRTGTYRTWSGMVQRCSNPRSADFHNYGGRGIAVCERWRSFDNFLADVGERPPGMSLDRIDNDGNYEPGNVRWATRSENDRNRRSSRWVDYRGERRLLIELCEAFGVRWDTAAYRIRSGWTVEDAVETPARPKAPAAARRAA